LHFTYNKRFPIVSFADFWYPAPEDNVSHSPIISSKQQTLSASNAETVPQTPFRRRRSMSNLVTHFQKHGSQSNVNEFVNNNRQTSENLACFPGNREQIPLNVAKKNAGYALGAGDRQFESGHPDSYLFLYNSLQEEVFLCPARYCEL
jgi:hypothetical protein